MSYKGHYPFAYDLSESVIDFSYKLTVRFVWTVKVFKKFENRLFLQLLPIKYLENSPIIF